MQSMDEIYRAHSQTVYRYLLSLTHDADVSEELTQETFYQAIKSIRRFDGSCKITTWLCAIAKNLFAAYRRKHPQTEPWDDALILTSSTEEEALSNTLCLEILRGMHLLNEEMREVMYLRALGGLSFREIGEILDRTENWARVTYYRGKEKLKKELEPNG